MEGTPNVPNSTNGIQLDSTLSLFELYHVLSIVCDVFSVVLRPLAEA